jgi:hypothetical protein
MLKFKSLTISSLLFTVSIISSYLCADSLSQENRTISSIEEAFDINPNLVIRSRRDCHSFKLKDFSGKWAFNVLTVGGVSGDSASGISGQTDMQISFNEKGIGVVNFYSSVIYSGVPGDLENTTLPPGTATAILTLKHPHLGVGTLTIKNAGGIVSTFDFIAAKSCDKAIQIEGHYTFLTPSINFIAHLSGLRQFDQSFVACCHKNSKKIKLKDFQGPWIFSFTSVGGLAGLDTTGTAHAVDVLVSFDSHGLGVLDFGSASDYSGTPGDVTLAQLIPKSVTFIITLTDPENGIAEMMVDNSISGVKESFDIVVNKKSKGQAILMGGHATQFNTLVTFADRFVGIRQHQ